MKERVELPLKPLCPVCNRPTSGLVWHHWTENSDIHITKVCKSCNYVLGFLFKRHYPSLSTQVEKTRQYLLDQEKITTLPTGKVSEFIPSTLEEASLLYYIKSNREKVDSWNSRPLVPPEVIPTKHRRILELREKGHTLEFIGKETFLTKERIRQILRKYTPPKSRSKSSFTRADFKYFKSLVKEGYKTETALSLIKRG